MAGFVVPGGFNYDIGEGLAAAGLGHAPAKLRPGGFLHQLAAAEGIVGKGHQPVARAGRRAYFEPQHIGLAVEVVGFEANTAGFGVAFEGDELEKSGAGFGYAHTAVPGAEDGNVEFVAGFQRAILVVFALEIGQQLGRKARQVALYFAH